MKRYLISTFVILGLLLLVAILWATPKASALTPTVGPTSPAKPDLSILSVVGHQNGLAPSGCVLNAVNNDLQVTVQNVGNAASGVFEVSASGRIKANQAVPSLAVGATVVLTFADLPADSMNVITVDSTGLVAESQEGNNTSNYTSPTLAPPCTSTPTPPGFKTPTKTPTGTSPCIGVGQVAFDHAGGAGMVNVPIFAANNTGTPNPGMVATTGPYGQFKTGCMAGKAVYGQSSGLTFIPTSINVSGSSQSSLPFVAMGFGMPTYTSTPNGPTLTPTRTPTVTPVSTSGDVPWPDLTISSITYAGSNPACINSPKNNVVVSNIGSFPAGTFVVSFSVNGMPQTPQTVSGLGAGQSVTLSFNAGSTVTATADSTSVISETNESNNSLTVNLPVPTQAHTCTPTSGTPVTPTRTPTRTNTPSGSNLALNKPVTCSSVENGGMACANPVDGNTGTRWSSAFSDPQWIQVDLGSTQSIGHVTLRWEAAFATAYQIQTSNDGVTWTNIYSTTTGDGGVDNLTGLTGSGRYIRMYGGVRATQYGYSLWEFEVYTN